ncbi:hypothetical protein DFJ74DRAFT_696259 [Hyaloraphidium curvatum]|nr:hypothetical protein DFJ74DRAFT_696259 [Hyaloraphidium curvatum]
MRIWRRCVRTSHALCSPLTRSKHIRLECYLVSPVALIVVGATLLLVTVRRLRASEDRPYTQLRPAEDGPDTQERDACSKGSCQSEFGIALPLHLNAIRYVNALTELELERRNATGRPYAFRFKDYLKERVPSFEQCSAWAGHAYLNAFRERSFDLCDGGDGIEWNLTEPLFRKEHWQGMDDSYFRLRDGSADRRIVKTPSVRCFLRSDLDPRHHWALCFSTPGTTVLLPRGSYPITQCYLRRDKEGDGCAMGWEDPAKSGAFPGGTIRVPSCSLNPVAKQRFNLVAGCARKFALSLYAPDELSHSASTQRDGGAGSVATIPSDFDTIPAEEPSCRHVVKEPVWFLERLDPRNIYHGSEDHSHAFVTLALLPPELLQAMSLHSVRIVFVDPQEDGPFLEFWQRVSQPHGIRFLHKEPYPPGTCFVGGTIWGLHALRSLFTLELHPIPWRTAGAGCRSTILEAFSRWQRDLFRERTHVEWDPGWDVPSSIHGSTIPDMSLFCAKDEALPLVDDHWYMDREKGVSKASGIQFQRRRHVILWLSRRVHEATMPNLTSWQAVRMLSAEMENCIVRGILDLALFRNLQQCINLHPPDDQLEKCRRSIDHFWDVEYLEPSDATLLDQVERVGHADIIVGVHGAALTHAVFLSPGSAMVEWVKPANPHYEILAKHMGHGYFPSVMKRNVRELLQALVSAMKWTEGTESWANESTLPLPKCDTKK